MKNLKKRILFWGLLTVFFVEACDNKYHPPGDPFDWPQPEGEELGGSGDSINNPWNEGDLVSVKRYFDDFEGSIKDFWDFERVADSRIQIVADPTNSQNKVLQVQVLKGDVTASGHRAEVKINGYENTEGRIARYSFKFMLPESFFQIKEGTSVIIQQWHDQPEPGGSWSNHEIRHPPVDFYIKTGPDPSQFTLSVSMGLWGPYNGVDVKENKNYILSEKLKPDKWYTVESEISWSMKDINAHIRSKVNGKQLINGANFGHEFRTRNIFDPYGNYPKMGIYANDLMDYDKVTVFFDDFDFEILQRPDYEPVEDTSKVEDPDIVELDKDLFEGIHLPSDNPYDQDPWYHQQKWAWDGYYNTDPDDYESTNHNTDHKYQSALTGDSPRGTNPSWITFSLGTEAHLTKLVLHTYFPFLYSTPKRYEIWGSLEKIDDFEDPSWIKLGESDNLPVSGDNDGGAEKQEDIDAWIAGDTVILDDESKVQYVRFKLLENYKSTTDIQIAELDLWGYE